MPIVFENRQPGASKISKTEILKALQTVARLGWERLHGRLGVPYPTTHQKRQ